MRYLIAVVVTVLFAFVVFSALFASISHAQTAPTPDLCGNTDLRRKCLKWDYSNVRADNKTPFYDNQAKYLYIIFNDQIARKFDAPPTKTFLTAPCVKGNYKIYIEDTTGNISDFSKSIFVDSTPACSPVPLAPIIRCDK